MAYHIRGDFYIPRRGEGGRSFLNVFFDERGIKIPSNMSMSALRKKYIKFRQDEETHRQEFQQQKNTLVFNTYLERSQGND